MSKCYVDVLKNKRGKWYWRLRAGNKNILAHSETYSSYAKCINVPKKLISGDYEFTLTTEGEE